jgi:RNA polymerase sigma factor (sigma-70 family)
MAMEEICAPRSLERIMETQENGPALALEEYVGREDPELIRTEERIAWGQVLGELEPRVRALLTLRFYKNLSQQETARRLGMSQMQVSRMERHTLDQLRERIAAL